MDGCLYVLTLESEWIMNLQTEYWRVELCQARRRGEQLAVVPQDMGWIQC